MSNTITIRLDPDLARWLRDFSCKTGVSQGKVIRDQLEKVRANRKSRSFMRLAGAIKGPKNLSSRKGFSKE